MRRFAIAIAIAMLVVVVVNGTTNALTRSYLTDDLSIKTGMVVATSGLPIGSADEASLVQKANQSNAELSVGIVTDIQDSELSYADNNKGEVLVANSGQVQAYVSDINGKPKSGDLLVPSQLEGILMLADKNSKGVIGSASTNFPDNATDYQLKDGYKTRIAIIPVNMDIHPVNAKPNNVVQDLASRIVGHDVTLIQAVLGAAIFMLTLVVVGGMMYGAIANYVVSIGRNPLGKNILFRGLFRIAVLTVIVLSVGVSVSLAVLWL